MSGKRLGELWDKIGIRLEKGWKKFVISIGEVWDKFGKIYIN